ncbi:MAG TPA: ABC transporter permease [Anaerolineales bacterium]|jgi:ABC-type transport system involved in multi-copper enzyme maturation permease subunit|nr:ABC transporter permease [Anaerolineales bacterium]
MAVFTIARLTFREALRRRILLAALLLGLAFLAVYGIGFHYVNQELTRSRSGPDILQSNEIRNFLFMAGLYAVNFLTIMMTVLTSVVTISGEISSGTIHTLVAKPLRRWEIISGKWLGFAVMLTLYLVLMAGGVTLLVYLLSGYRAPNVPKGLAMIWLNALLLLSVSLMGGAFLSTLANGVLVFGLYGIAFLGGWIEQFGAMVQNQTAVNIGVISSLIIPSEALWKRAAFEMQSPMVRALGFSPFSSPSVPSPVMIWYAVLYTLLALTLAIRLFSKRDL